MFCRDILKLFSSLKAYSLINDIKQRYIINIYHVYNNIIIKLDIILNREFKPTRRFFVFLVILIELNKIL
jgi:hypothetical protein